MLAFFSFQTRYNKVTFNFGSNREGSFSFDIIKQGGNFDEIYYLGQNTSHEVKFSPTQNKFVLRIGELDMKQRLNDSKNSKRFKIVFAAKNIVPDPHGNVTLGEFGFIFLEGDGSTIEIPFEVNKNGLGQIKIDFDVIKTRDENDPSVWKGTGGSIVFNFNVNGMVDLDPDKDGYLNSNDNCPNVENADQLDQDKDGVGDVCDNCISTPNSDQLDEDKDGFGNACDKYPGKDDSEEDDRIKKEYQKVKTIYDNVNKEDLQALCGFIEIYPSFRDISDKARKHLSTLDENSWLEAEETPNEELGYKAYIDYVAICPARAGAYLGQAQAKIYSIRLAGEWNQLKRSGTQTELASFLDRYGNYRGEVVQKIRDSFPSLDLSLSRNGDRFVEVYFNNSVFNPRYKDISLKAGLAINDANWETDKKLEIRIQNEGAFKLLIQDSIGRDTILNFGYQFGVTQIPSEDNLVQLKVEGGQKPYWVSLFDQEENEVWNASFIDSDIKLDKKELIKQGLQGDYKVSVRHSDEELDEVMLAEVLNLKKSNKTMIISILIGLISLLILALVIVPLQKKLSAKKKKQTVITYT